MDDYSDSSTLSVIAQKAIRNAEAALRIVTDDRFVPTEKNVRIGYKEISGNSIISVSFALPTHLAPTQADAEAIADRARDKLLMHSVKLQSLNDVAPPPEALSVEKTEGGFKVVFQMYGNIQDLAQTSMPPTSIVTGRSDRTR